MYSMLTEMVEYIETFRVSVDCLFMKDTEVVSFIRVDTKNEDVKTRKDKAKTESV